MPRKLLPEARQALLSAVNSGENLSGIAQKLAPQVAVLKHASLTRMVNAGGEQIKIADPISRGYQYGDDGFWRNAQGARLVPKTFSDHQGKQEFIWEEEGQVRNAKGEWANELDVRPHLNLLSKNIKDEVDFMLQNKGSYDPKGSFAIVPNPIYKGGSNLEASKQIIGYKELGVLPEK
jgi:hypothetical protein